MKSEFQKRHRPIGISILVVISVIIGIINFIGAFLPPAEEEAEGYKGVSTIFNVIFPLLGIIYVVLAIGFFRANAWALKLYNNVNRALSIITIFYSNLVTTFNTGPEAAIISQFTALGYTFVVNSYLQKDYVKLYFGSTNSSRSPVQTSPS